MQCCESLINIFDPQDSLQVILGFSVLLCHTITFFQCNSLFGPPKEQLDDQLSLFSFRYCWKLSTPQSTFMFTGFAGSFSHLCYTNCELKQKLALTSLCLVYILLSRIIQQEVIADHIKNFEKLNTDSYGQIIISFWLVTLRVFI